MIVSRELACAPAAHERFVTSVEAHVTLEMSVSGEPLATLVAHERLVGSDVRSHVES